MGNSHSSHNPNGSSKSLSRNNSKKELHDVDKLSAKQLLPTDLLAKVLTEKSVEQDIQGIGCSVFKKYLFAQYPELGRRIFAYLITQSGYPASSHVISTAHFRTQAEKIIGILTEEQQVSIYINMFADGKDDIDQKQFTDLLYTVYKLTMDHYPEGPQSCRHIFKTLKAVVDSAFHKKEVLGLSYISHWIQQNCPKVIILLHQYVVHVLSTGHRTVSENLCDNRNKDLELTTPVLEQGEPSFSSLSGGGGGCQLHSMLPLSQVWILATTLPPLYTRPTQHSPPNGNGAPHSSYFSKFLHLSCPSHWTLLYNSNQDGLGANRFLHHVLSYKGPTLTFLRGEGDNVFCIGATSEWHESHQYWGAQDCIILQILPLYRVIEKGQKLIYLNSAIRGYPLGIRAGADPRKPALDINADLSQVTYQGAPYALYSVEVWGCGDTKSRETQLDIKNWQVKQAEKQRCVKLSAKEWIDHPDRYLLEMAGRTNYVSDGDRS
uniref:TLDc domain-containing protein n=1 Tax=Cacopsylla melanoneura TaxID=428564 RepID=A0A8D8SCC1_9HEMI